MWRLLKHSVRLADGLGIKEGIEFLGFRDGVVTLLVQSDVVHASTHGEPLGQMVNEGMAAGKPVIATDGGSLPKIAEAGKTGLVPMGDATTMAEVIASLLSDPWRRVIGEAGSARVQERFTIHRTAFEIQALSDRLLDVPVGAQAHMKEQYAR